ncbi:Vasculin [Trichinella pseudospiralis]
MARIDFINGLCRHQYSCNGFHDINAGKKWTYAKRPSHMGSQSTGVWLQHQISPDQRKRSCVIQKHCQPLRIGNPACYTYECHPPRVATGPCVTCLFLAP